MKEIILIGFFFIALIIFITNLFYYFNASRFIKLIKTRYPNDYENLGKSSVVLFWFWTQFKLFRYSKGTKLDDLEFSKLSKYFRIGFYAEVLVFVLVAFIMIGFSILLYI